MRHFSLKIINDKNALTLNYCLYHGQPFPSIRNKYGTYDKKMEMSTHRKHVHIAQKEEIKLVHLTSC